jgi:hypothetical protein
MNSVCLSNPKKLRACVAGAGLISGIRAGRECDAGEGRPTSLSRIGLDLVCAVRLDYTKLSLKEKQEPCS